MSLSCLLLAALPAQAVGPLNAGAKHPLPPQAGRPLLTSPPRALPQGIGPFVYDPNATLYEWEIEDYPGYEPCYYNQDYGQWTGQCNLSYDTPGFSITVPNQLNR